MKKLLSTYKNLSVQVKASLWFIASTVLLKGISFITMPIFTRIMSTDQYGIYSVYLTWYEMLTVVGTLSLESCAYMSALTKFDENGKSEAQLSLLELSFFITSILMVAVLLSGDKLPLLIGLPKDMILLMILQIYFVPAVNFWLVRSRFRYKYIGLVFVSLSMAMMNALLGIFFVLNFDNEYQAYGRVFSIVLIQLVYGIVLFCILNKGQKIKIITKYWKWGIRLHIPLLPHTMSLKILGSADRIMINTIVGSTAAALYSVAFSIAIVVNLVKSSIVDALRPWIYQKLKEHQVGVMQKVFNGVLLFVALLTLVFVAFAPEVIYIAAPHNYYAAVYCMPPVMISSFFTFLYSVFSIIEMYYEETKKIMAASVSAASLNIILNLIFIPIFGYIAAAFTTLICYIFLAVFHYCMVKSILKKKNIVSRLFDNRVVIGLSIIMLTMMMLFEFLYSHVVLRYVFVFVIVIVLVIKRKFFMDLLTTIRQN